MGPRFDINRNQCFKKLLAQIKNKKINDDVLGFGETDFTAKVPLCHTVQYSLINSNSIRMWDEESSCKVRTPFRQLQVCHIDGDRDRERASDLIVRLRSSNRLTALFNKSIFCSRRRAELSKKLCVW